MWINSTDSAARRTKKKEPQLLSLFFVGGAPAGYFTARTPPSNVTRWL